MNGGTLIINDGTLEIANTAGFNPEATLMPSPRTAMPDIFRYNSTNAQTLSGVISGARIAGERQ